MTEEEKKAIDEFKSRREYFEYQPEGCNWQLSFDQWEVESIIDVILNLIQKQDTEINKLNKEIKQLKEDISNMYDEKIVRNILEELGLSKMEIEEILN